MKDLFPIHYDLCLFPDLTLFTFSGQVELQIFAAKAMQTVTLHALELTIEQCLVKQGGDYVSCPFSMDSQKETISIQLPQEMKDDIWIRIDFEGSINDKMEGFYQSSYTYNGNKEPLAVTQFEESAARMAFPCFDHPAYKATFDVTLVVEDEYIAVSNGAVLNESHEDNGKKRVRFETTPKMSTYLLFFGVGKFEFIQDGADPRVRAAGTPGQTDKAGLGLEFGRKALQFCEEYFKIPYPMSKMDLIAVPDFAFGAMENWGAITFRENLLLFDSAKTSQAGKERLCEVIAHEIVHQWFGNLVSPSDWRYLWLNESFATYFGFGVVHHYYPQWQTWQQFLYSQTSTAMARDALFETFPIEIPGGEHVVINAATAPIIYNKGASILNQMKGHIGADNFQNGLVQYLTEHAYNCTESHHLWEAFETTAEMPVTAMMKSWIEQPGFPLITVESNGETLTLTQERFTYLSQPPANGDAISQGSPQPWLIPVAIEVFYDNGRSTTQKLLFDEKQMTLAIEPNATAFKVNSGQTGFYRVHYSSPKALQNIGKKVADKVLSPEDRWGLQEDLFALVRSARLPLEEYLSFLTCYQDEDAFLPLISIADNLFLSYLAAPVEKRKDVAASGKSFLEAVLEKIGFVPEEDEPNTTRILRDSIIYKAVIFGSTFAQNFAQTAFQDLMGGVAVHPDIMKSVMMVGAINDSRTAFEWFKNQIQTTESEHERMNILLALGCLSDETVSREAMQYALTSVPSRNQHIPFIAFARNPHATEMMWAWYVDHVPELEAFHPLLYERVIEAIVPICGLGHETQVEAFFEAYLAEKNKAEAVIKLSLERLRINERMRAALSSDK
jgi:aminopeptidase N